MNTNCYEVKNRVQIFTGYNTWTDSSGKEYKTACYDWAATHKLPGGLKYGDIVWKRDIRKKLKKWHLSWIKPQYELPIWLSFHIFNYDVGWKTKWDDTRYEWPPQFTIVFFGLAFSIWLSAPKCDGEHFSDDGYWEGVIDYGFYKKKEDFDLERFIKEQGYMHLTEMFFLRKEVPFGENPLKSKKILYRIEDPFMAFYYKFVEPNKSMIALGRGNIAKKYIEDGFYPNVSTAVRRNIICNAVLKRDIM